jgi:hypothetical protein
VSEARAAVSGVSGDGGRATVRSLRDAVVTGVIPGVFLLGLDNAADSPEHTMCDAVVAMPPVADPGYVGALITTLRLHRIGAYFPAIDSEIPVLSRHREWIASETGATLCSSG